MPSDDGCRKIALLVATGSLLPAGVFAIFIRPAILHALLVNDAAIAGLLAARRTP
jgi:hypothetical protein